MKNIVNYFLFSLLFIIITSCSEDEGLEKVISSTPTNISVDFQIEQDNSGEVTIYPSAEGANTFMVDYGDGSEFSEAFATGSSMMHTYEEGTYEVTVTAMNLAGDAASTTKTLVVSFSAPENLEVTITNNPSNPYAINVSAEADYAASFEVYFGDVVNEEPTPMMIGETITHEYATIGTYDVTVVALSGGVETTTYTQQVQIVNPLAFPITFDNTDINYEFVTFNGVTYAVVQNPDLSGSNPDQNLVGEITNAGNNWEGGSFNLGIPIDFGGEEKNVVMDFWSNTPVDVLLKFEAGVNGERENEVTVSHSGSGWEELTFNYAEDAIKSYVDGATDNGESFVPIGQYSVMTMFIDGAGTTAGSFYVDNIEQTAGVLNAPTSAAPTPQIPETNVISMFSDAYSDVPVSTWATSWSDATYEEVDIAGNPTKKYSVLNYVGIETPAPYLDVSSMTHFHTDVWTANSTQIRVKLVDFGADGAFGGGDDVEHEVAIDNFNQGEWIQLDIPLTDFSGLTTNQHIGQLIYSGNPTGAHTIYVDNIYFHN
ncbi:PKD domain-containing protein [Mesonia aestuariivivens]|uniref:PKD/Chitinase domain-containing protein n=1 Tax=Mesonia aestuariivivens TaxID=2796128 RepID=A0ABS6W337_9FLAO|nr:hypothetical protein [Mesonia aestuariivivens]MBW2962265.1 hypothetical protein [Mesonia aestuariivivens]